MCHDHNVLLFKNMLTKYKPIKNVNKKINWYNNQEKSHKSF